MNIFNRKKPVAIQASVIPPKPGRLMFCSAYDGIFVPKEPIVDNGKVFYPVGRQGGTIADYYETRNDAEAVCASWNIIVNSENKKLKAKRAKQIAIRNREIEEWNKKYAGK